MSKVSVIIPIYNAGQYLEQCLNSVINQTFKDIEIICINDGSTDNSVEILNEYAKNDSRLIIISQENKGQGNARNAGLKAAKGEFIQFVDADDFIDLDCVEKLYNKIKENDSDICVYGCFLLYNKGIILEDCYNSNKYSLDNNFKFSHFEPVLKMYKRQFIENCHIKFPNELIFEDVLFSIKSFLLTNKIVILNENLYYYRQTVGSTMDRVKNNNKVFDILSIIREVELFLKQSNLYEKYKKEFLYFVIGQINYHNNRITDNKLRKRFLVEAKAYIKTKKNEIYKNVELKRKYKKLFTPRIFTFFFDKQKTELHKIYKILGIKIKFKRKI